ncbi:restriction endonuclease subunit S [Streptomyces acidicola]|uniref:restriction endonuclease subunit S n=1 Tax=Streptomyces acidicola TaxID=2596892 RepID=UPI003799F582
MPDRIVPPGWRHVSLGDITVEQGKRVGNASQDITVLSSTKHHGLVPSNEYFKNRVVYSDDLSSYKVVHKGWFAYATNHLTEGSIGLQRDHGNACVSPIYTVFSCSEDVDEEYLHLFVKSAEAMKAYAIHDQASVDRRGAVRYRDFAKVQLVLPPLKEQRRISEILATIDRKIAQCQALAWKFAAVRDQIIDRLLTDSFYLAPYARLEEVASVERGRFSIRPRNDPSYYGGAYHFIQTGDVVRANGGVIESSSQTLNKRGFSASREFPKGAIAVTIAATIGATAILGKEMCFPDSVVGIVPRGGYDSRFLERCINRARHELEALAPQSAQKNINLQDLRPLKIPQIELEAQRRVVAGWEKFEAQRAAAESELQKMLTLKQALMSDLLNGHVRVPVSVEL